MTGPRISPVRFGMAYAVALVIMLPLDGLWLGWVARDFYRREMAEVMAASPQLLPAAVFYLLYPLGLVCLGLVPRPANVMHAVLRCAALGLFAYATYDLTNLSVMRGWSLELSLIDSAWGTLLSAVVGGLTYRLVLARAA